MNTSTRKGPARVVFDKVTKRYGTNVTAVDQISLDFPAGTLVTLLGPSGCGKTTTLRMIAGLEMASSGRIFIGDDEYDECWILDVFAPPRADLVDAPSVRSER